MSRLPCRVVVQDRRRLIREGLGSILGAEDGVDIVAVIALAAELSNVTDSFDVVLSGDPDELPHELSGSGRRVVRLVDHAPGAIVQMLTGSAARTHLSAVEEPGAPAATSALTSREVQVMQGIGEGLSTAEIGNALGISAKTVENHKQRIFDKLGVQSQAHAIVISRSAGLLESARPLANGSLA